MPTNVAKNTVYLFAASVAQKVFSFIYFTLIARSIGVERTGMYVTALTLSSLFSIMTDLGLTPVLIREGAKDKSRLPAILGNVLIVKIFLDLVAYGFLALVVWLLGYPWAIRELVWFSGLIMVLDSVSLSFYGALRSQHNLWFESWGVVLGQVITVTAGGVMLWRGAPLPFLLLALGLGSLFNVLWSGGMLISRLGLRPRLVFDKGLFHTVVKYALPFALAGVFTKVYSYIDTVLLSRLLGNKAVGWYSVPYKLTFAFQFVPMAFAAALYPAMSTFFVQDKNRLKGLFEKGIIYLAMLALPISFGIGAMAEIFIVKVYGPDYLPSVLPLKILLASLVFAFLDFPVGSLLNACNRQSVQTAAMGVTMGLNIVLNVILIPRLGVVGAAISALVGNFTLCALGYLWVPKIIPAPKSELWWRLAKVLLSAGLMGWVVKAMQLPLGKIIRPEGFFPTVLFLATLIITGGIVYGLMLLLFRAVHINEVKEILGIFKKSKVEEEEL